MTNLELYSQTILSRSGDSSGDAHDDTIDALPEPSYPFIKSQNIDDYGSMNAKHFTQQPTNKLRRSSSPTATFFNRYFTCEDKTKIAGVRASIGSRDMLISANRPATALSTKCGGDTVDNNNNLPRTIHRIKECKLRRKSTLTKDMIKINLLNSDEDDQNKKNVEIGMPDYITINEQQTSDVVAGSNISIDINSGSVEDNNQDEKVKNSDDAKSVDDADDEMQEQLPIITGMRTRRGAVTSKETTSDYRLYNIVSKNGQRHQVYVCVVFLKIGEIDTIKEQYAADVLIKSKWREPLLDNHVDQPEYDWANSWSPKLYIENTIGEAKEHVYHMITFNEFNHAFLCEKRRVSGVFLENLELNHFPFDVQDLTITVASNLPTSEIRLVNDPDEAHRINKQSFVDEQEWYLYKHIETEQRELAYEYTDPTTVRPALSVKCRAARRPAYFIWNIFLVTFLICSLSLVTFAVDKGYPQNRLQLTYTLVLTLVAFKFVVNQCLPKISYLTYLDKYVISSLFILTLICLWHGLIVVIEKISARFKYQLPEDMEVYVIIAMAVAYVMYNVGFIVMIYSVACRRRRDMKQRDREYVEKVQCQMKYKGMRAMRMIQQTHQLHEVKENGNATFI